MCCRFALRKAPARLTRALPDVANADAVMNHFAPRYNIAPTQPVLAVRSTQALGGRAEFTFLSWGLVPHWAKDASGAGSLFNARAESAAFKPSFKGPLRHHRCLIPADGFYEWASGSRQREDGHYSMPRADGHGSAAAAQHPAKGSRAPRSAEAAQPYFFSLPQDEVFCFAALWEHWGSPDGSEIESCALLTAAANADIRPYHDRMPLLIAERDFERWLDPALQSPESVADLLLPPPAGLWQARPVADTVGSTRNNGPECLLPPPPPRQQELF